MASRQFGLSGDPAQTASAISAAVKQLDPNLPLKDLKTLTPQVRDNTFLDRMMTTLSASFAGLATLLAAVGLYGVLDCRCVGRHNPGGRGFV